ncbi:anti-sigma factor [Arthrobacter sp. ISL-48]|nr:anti-sigma factor [Arthrobacter sp. ISL-48]
MNRERQYIERLRDAAVPPASQDLTARLLAHTEMLAAASPAPAPGQHRAARVLAFTAGGTAAAAGVLAVGAFALAGDNVPVARDAFAGSLAQHTAQLPADGRQLSEAQLTQLRSEGWVCPELGSLGFHVQSARTTTVQGRPAVELQLWDGQHYATVLEQHSEAGQPAADGELRISSSEPWTATYQTPAGTLTYKSDLPAEQADDAIPLLKELSALAAEGINTGVTVEPAAAQSGAPDESLGDRLQRGIRKIAQMLTP